MVKVSLHSLVKKTGETRWPSRPDDLNYLKIAKTAIKKHKYQINTISTLVPFQLMIVLTLDDELIITIHQQNGGVRIVRQKNLLMKHDKKR